MLPDATWERCREALRPDGSLCDIVVEDASPADWNAVLAALPTWYRSISYAVKAQDPSLPYAQTPIPTLASEVMWAGETFSLLQVVAGRITICCHFFDQGEIEFDVLPNEIVSADDFSDLLTFMRRLGSLLKKEVLLTGENVHDRPIVKYSPGDDSLLYCLEAG